MVNPIFCIPKITSVRYKSRVASVSSVERILAISEGRVKLAWTIPNADNFLSVAKK